MAGPLPAGWREREVPRAAGRAGVRPGSRRRDAGRRARHAAERRRRAAWRAQPPEPVVSGGAVRRGRAVEPSAETAQSRHPSDGAAPPATVPAQPGAGHGSALPQGTGCAGRAAGSGVPVGPGRCLMAGPGAPSADPAHDAGGVPPGLRRELHAERAGLRRRHPDRRHGEDRVLPVPAHRHLAPVRQAWGRGRAGRGARRDRERRLPRRGVGPAVGLAAAVLRDCREKPERRRGGRRSSSAVWPCPGMQAASTGWRRLKEAEMSLSWFELVPWPT